MKSRIYIRAFELEDYLLINKWRSNINVTKYLVGNVFFVSKERERISVESKILDDSKNVYFAICENESNKMIGYCQINNIDLRNLKAEWGGTLIGETNYINGGYGKEASKLMLRFLFDQYPINKCYGYCLEEHPHTTKLLLDLGFQKDGILRDDVFKNGEYKNILLYSILRSEINGKF